MKKENTYEKKRKTERVVKKTQINNRDQYQKTQHRREQQQREKMRRK